MIRIYVVPWGHPYLDVYDNVLGGMRECARMWDVY